MSRVGGGGWGRWFPFWQVKDNLAGKGHSELFAGDLFYGEAAFAEVLDLLDESLISFRQCLDLSFQFAHLGFFPLGGDEPLFPQKSPYGQEDQEESKNQEQGLFPFFPANLGSDFWGDPGHRRFALGRVVQALIELKTLRPG